MIEVELKFPVASIEEIRSHLQSLGAISEGVSIQADEYFNDPKRNYAKLDIAVRIRQSDDEFWLTFKGAESGSSGENPKRDRNAT